jgi:hypothetical protein
MALGNIYLTNINSNIDYKSEIKVKEEDIRVKINMDAKGLHKLKGKDEKRTINMELASKFFGKDQNDDDEYESNKKDDTDRINNIVNSTMNNKKINPIVIKYI